MKNELEKEEIVNGVKYRYSTDWVYSLESDEHWRLYWHQQNLMQNKILPGQRVLEIGFGSGFTANYLCSKGIEVITLDIDAEKKPDIVANVVLYDFHNIDMFDHILAFEVFEHIPYNEFEAVVQKISKICRHFLFLSVPRNDLVLFECSFKLPLVEEKSFRISIPRRKFASTHHFWELNHTNTPKKKFECSIENAGFDLISQESAFSRVFYAFEKLTNENKT